MHTITIKVVGIVCKISHLHTIANACAYHVDLWVGAYTLTQEEEEGSASGELNQVSGQQDLDQSPEESKVVANIEDGKHLFHITFWDKISTFTSQLLLFTLCI
jgi:hypothetical protein